jgi:hypothetical protein
MLMRVFAKFIKKEVTRLQLIYRVREACIFQIL